MAVQNIYKYIYTICIQSLSGILDTHTTNLICDRPDFKTLLLYMESDNSFSKDIIPWGMWILT